MLCAVLFGLCFGIAGLRVEEDPLLAVGRFKVAATVDRNTEREGTLCVTSSGPSQAFGYIDWKGKGEFSRTIEQFVVTPVEDGKFLAFCAYRTQALGAVTPPLFYVARRTGNPKEIVAVEYSDHYAVQPGRSWSAKRVSDELSASAPDFEPTILEGDDRSVALQSLAGWIRAGGSESMGVPCIPVLSGLRKSSDPFVRDLVAKRLETERLEQKFREAADTTAMEREIQTQVQGVLLEGLARMFIGGEEMGIRDVGERFGSRGGAIDRVNQWFQAQLKAAAVSLAADHGLREFVREEYSSAAPVVEWIDSAGIELGSFGEGGSVMLSLTNRTGARLSNVVISSELAMDGSLVGKDILARNVAELPFQVLNPFLGLDDQVAAAQRTNLDLAMALYAVPIGALAYLEAWEPDVTIELRTGVHPGQLIRYAESGELWVGADGHELRTSLDVDSMRQEIIRWRAAGSPKRVRRAATEFHPEGESSNRTPSAERPSSLDPLAVAQAIAAAKPRGLGYGVNTSDLAKNPNVRFVLEVMESLGRSAAPNGGSSLASQIEDWRSSITLSGLTESQRARFPALLGERNPAVRGLETALIGTGCGKPVSAEEVRPGDFVQYWWKGKTGNEWKLENMHIGIVSKVEPTEKGRRITIFGAHRSLLASESSLKPADRSGGIGESVPIDLADPSTSIAFFARWTKRHDAGN